MSATTDAPRTIKYKELTLNRERSFRCGAAALSDMGEYRKMGEQAVVRYYRGRAWLYVEPVVQKSAQKLP